MRPDRDALDDTEGLAVTVCTLKVALALGEPLVAPLADSVRVAAAVPDGTAVKDGERLAERESVSRAETDAVLVAPLVAEARAETEGDALADDSLVVLPHALAGALPLVVTLMAAVRVGVAVAAPLSRGEPLADGAPDVLSVERGDRECVGVGVGRALWLALPLIRALALTMPSSLLAGVGVSERGDETDEVGVRTGASERGGDADADTELVEETDGALVVLVPGDCDVVPLGRGEREAEALRETVAVMLTQALADTNRETAAVSLELPLADASLDGETLADGAREGVGVRDGEGEKGGESLANGDCVAPSPVSVAAAVESEEGDAATTLCDGVLLSDAANVESPLTLGEALADRERAAEGEIAGDVLSLIDGAAEADAKADRVAVRDERGERLDVEEAVRGPEPLPAALTEGELVTDTLPAAERDVAGEGESDARALCDGTLGVERGVCVPEPEPDADALGVARALDADDDEPRAVAAAVALSLASAVAVCGAELFADAEGQPEDDGELPRERVGKSDAGAVPLTAAVAYPEAVVRIDAVAHGVAESGLAVPLAETGTVALAADVLLLLGVAVGVIVGTPLARSLALPAGLPVAPLLPNAEEDAAADAGADAVDTPARDESGDTDALPVLEALTSRDSDAATEEDPAAEVLPAPLSVRLGVALAHGDSARDRAAVSDARPLEETDAEMLGDPLDDPESEGTAVALLERAVVGVAEWMAEAEDDSVAVAVVAGDVDAVEELVSTAEAVEDGVWPIVWTLLVLPRGEELAEAEAVAHIVGCALVVSVRDTKGVDVDDPEMVAVAVAYAVIVRTASPDATGDVEEVEESDTETSEEGDASGEYDVRGLGDTVAHELEDGDTWAVPDSDRVPRREDSAEADCESGSD